MAAITDLDDDDSDWDETDMQFGLTCGPCSEGDSVETENPFRFLETDDDGDDDAAVSKLAPP